MHPEIATAGVSAFRVKFRISIHQVKALIVVTTPVRMLIMAVSPPTTNQPDKKLVTCAVAVADAIGKVNIPGISRIAGIGCARPE